MNNFIKSIYLGDRLCNRIAFDAAKKEFVVEVDVISRVRSEDGIWNFYSEEDIERGELVFQNVSGLWLDKDGQVPNDQINYLELEEVEGKTFFVLSVDSIDSNGANHEAVMKIEAENLVLRDPQNPNIFITE